MTACSYNAYLRQCCIPLLVAGFGGFTGRPDQVPFPEGAQL